MRPDRFPDLQTPQVILIHLADHITGADLDAIHKLHRIIAPIDVRHHETFFILIQTIRKIVKVRFLRHRARHLADAALSLAIKLNRRRRYRLRQIDPLQVHIALRRRSAGLGNTNHPDLLHQMLLVRIHRIEAVNHIVQTILLVRRRIPKRHQRVELLQILLRLLPFHRLRLIDDYNGICLCDDIDRTARTELIKLHADTAGILPLRIERLGINDHDTDRIIRRETIDFRQLLGIIDEETHLLPILLGEMVTSHLERLVHPFADSDARHHDDELPPAIVLIQLIHSLDIGVRLPHTGLHLDGQIETALQRLRQLQMIIVLHLL